MSEPTTSVSSFAQNPDPPGTHTSTKAITIKIKAGPLVPGNTGMDAHLGGKLESKGRDTVDNDNVNVDIDVHLEP